MDARISGCHQQYHWKVVSLCQSSHINPPKIPASASQRRAAAVFSGRVADKMVLATSLCRVTERWCGFFCLSKWVFPTQKWGGGGFKNPKKNHPICLIGFFSLIFTIHFGGKPTIFGNTQMWSSPSIYTGDADIFFHKYWRYSNTTIHESSFHLKILVEL